MRCKISKHSVKLLLLMDKLPRALVDLPCALADLPRALARGQNSPHRNRTLVRLGLKPGGCEGHLSYFPELKHGAIQIELTIPNLIESGSVNIYQNCFKGKL